MRPLLYHLHSLCNRLHNNPISPIFAADKILVTFVQILNKVTTLYPVWGKGGTGKGGYGESASEMSDVGRMDSRLVTTGVGM